MDLAEMRRLRIGYWPLSPNLGSPGDRRRLAFWATARGHSVVTDLDQSVDVIVASENADFKSKYFKQNQVPVIFDLVDAYLSPLDPIDDLARGMAKRVTGQISGRLKPFSRHVKDFCVTANAVICSSAEQEELIKQYNSNTHVILDSHDEIPFVNPRDFPHKITNKHRILWEGQPATIRGIKFISEVIMDIAGTIPIELDFVTDQKYSQFLNKYIERDTLNLLKKDLGKIAYLAKIVAWSPENLLTTAMKSSLAVIPLDLSIPIQRLKPENRLFIMWRLGLPCLTSPSPAYARVAQHSGVNVVCNDTNDWHTNIERLITDPNYARNEILAGQRYLRENHNRSIILKKWDTAFESVMG